MKILSHRGAWQSIDERNSLIAFKHSLELGYGFESDVRDFNGELVISHDIATSHSPKLKDVLKLLRDFDDKFKFAINIKADGLIQILKSMLNEYQIENYFTFDMSVPQMIEYKNQGLKFFTRQSEYEKSPIFYEEANGIWIDAFVNEDWLTNELIESHLNNGKEVCIVSSDLHSRDNSKLWNQLKMIQHKNFYLCTDSVDEAKKYFN